MNDAGDGTYNYSFTIEKPGIISIYIFSSVSYSIDAIVYQDLNFSVNPQNRNWEKFDKYEIDNNTKSGSFSSYFKSPT